MHVRRTKSRQYDYFQLVRSYRNEEGKPRLEVLIHLGEHSTPEQALAQWPHEIKAHRRAGRDYQADKLREKLNKLENLTAN